MISWGSSWVSRVKLRATLLAVLIIVLGCLLVSCGGGGGGGGYTPPPPPAITSVSVSCNPTSVQTGQTSLCTAIVSGTGSYSSAVTWSATAGSINSSGQLTAPGSAGSVTITATSAQDTSKVGTTMVTVTAASAVGSLTLNIIGLPAGNSANVNVSGANGYSQNIAASVTLTLAAGTYTVVGNSVSVGASSYFPSLASQTAAVTGGGAVSVTVNYSTIIPKTTKVLDQTGMQSLTLSADGTTLTIPTSSPVAQALKAGDVLASAPTTAAPKGLLVKVVSVAQNGSEVDATVTQARLTDAVQQTHFTFSQPIGPSSAMRIRKALPGVKFLNKSRVRPEFQSVSDPCEGNPITAAQMYNVPLFNSPGLYVLAEGEIDVCPSIEFDIDFGFFNINSMTAKATLSEYAKVSLTGGGSVSVDKRIDIATVEFGDILVFVGPVPVLLTPTATFFVGANGNLSADFYTGITQEAQASAGISYANGQVTPLSNISFAASSVPLSLDANFNLKGYAGVEVGLQIDGVATPYFQPDAYLQFSADVNQNPWWTLGAGLEGAVGVHVGILGWNLAEIGPYQVFDYPLATLGQAPGGFSIGDVTPTITSISPNSVLAGSAPLTLGVNGSNFVPNSVVNFNGNPLSTTFFSDATGPNYLTATLPATYLVTPGVFPVTVSTPKGTTSNAVSFTVAAVGNPVTVTGLSFNPTSIAAGGSTTGTVTLSGPAPSGGAAVTLTSTNNSVLPVPSNVTISAGTSSATFAATASSSVANTTLVTVSASYNSSSQNATVTVTATPVVHVTVSPSTVTVLTGTPQQFTATVTGTSNTAVDWSVNGLYGGNSTVGTISSTGLYTAPTTVPNPSTVTVTATSQADYNASDSANVTITTSFAYTLLHSSTGAGGKLGPRAALIKAKDGYFYGTTTGEGVDYGSVFQMDTGGNVTILHSFLGPPDGAYPNASLIQARDGNFYGTTYSGGIYDNGTAFKIDTMGHISILHSFDYPEGINITSPLIQASDDNFYGTAFSSGLHGLGAVFKMDSAGNVSILYSFGVQPDGGFPWGPLVETSNGSFLGTTYLGGDFGQGTVYKVDTMGNLTYLHSFSGTDDGGGPLGGLIKSAEGIWYGTTWGGGASPWVGTIYKMDALGNLTTLHTFSGPDGAGPGGGLIQAMDGDFYGTTESGGAASHGVLFRMDLDGNVITLHSFSGAPDDGADPEAPPLQDSDGSFYGTTWGGGSYDSGTIFRLSGPGL